MCACVCVFEKMKVMTEPLAFGTLHSNSQNHCRFISRFWEGGEKKGKTRWLIKRKTQKPRDSPFVTLEGYKSVARRRSWNFFRCKCLFTVGGQNCTYFIQISFANQIPIYTRLELVKKNFFKLTFSTFIVCTFQLKIKLKLFGFTNGKNTVCTNDF